MSLYDFASGPALHAAAYVFLAGTLWRLIGILMLGEKPDFSAPRRSGGVAAAVRTIASRSFQKPVFRRATAYSNALSYVLHIGLFVTVFLFVPHIMFFEDIVGVDWPGLPDGVILAVSIATLVAGIALLVRRLTHPVLKLLSNFDDYFSWFVTVLPLATGLMMPFDLPLPYMTLLAIHMLSVALLLVWLPFGKLGHAFLVFLSRGRTGAILTRRGAKT